VTTRDPIGSATAALRLLGVADDAGAQEVRRSFRRAVRATHPDGGGCGGDVAALREARDLLLRRFDRMPDVSGRQRVFVRRRRPLRHAAGNLLRRRRRRVVTRKVR